MARVILEPIGDALPEGKEALKANCRWTVEN